MGIPHKEGVPAASGGGVSASKSSSPNGSSVPHILSLFPGILRHLSVVMAEGMGEAPGTAGLLTEAASDCASLKLMLHLPLAPQVTVPSLAESLFLLRGVRVLP